MEDLRENWQEKDFGIQYRKALSELITYEKLLQDDFGNFVYALSYFIYYSDPAYKYNPPFLPDQYEKFRIFLIEANKKYDALKCALDSIKASSKITKYFKTNPNEKSQIQISINHLLESDLNGEIILCKDFSISGAFCKPENDVYKILIKDTERFRTYSWISETRDIKNYNVDKIYNCLIRILVDLLEINR